MLEIKRIEKEQPEMTDVEIHVAYADTCDFVFNGAYKFRLMGEAKFNGLKVPAGFYQGKGQCHLQPLKGSHILFERFPLERPKTRKPIPVPDIINDISIEEQISRAIAQGIAQAKPDSETENLQFDDYDQDELDYIADEYLVEYPEDPEILLSDNLEEPEPPGNPEPDTVKAETDGDSPTLENTAPQ